MKIIRELKTPTSGLAEYLDAVATTRIGSNSALTIRERLTTNSGMP